MKFRVDDIEYELLRSGRKTVSIRITDDARVEVHAPWGAKREDVERFILLKRPWIEKHLAQAQERLQRAGKKLDGPEREELKRFARKLIMPRLEYFSSLMGVSYGKLSVKLLKTRFGSCSARKNLNFNALLALMPSEILDYVIVHELAHLVHLDHSPAFWQTVGEILPDYKKRRDWLKAHGGEYICRI